MSRKKFLLWAEDLEEPSDMRAADGLLYQAIKSAGLFLTKSMERPTKATVVFINDSPWAVVLSPDMVEATIEACEEHVRTNMKWTAVLPEDDVKLRKTGEHRKFGLRHCVFVHTKEVDLR